MRKILLFILLSLSIASNVSANEEIVIGTIEREPFSYQENGKWTGFSIDLWWKIAEETGFTYTFKEYSSFSELLWWTQNKDVDASVANISITLEREKKMDFSQPIFDSWLNIMIAKIWSELWIFDNKIFQNPQKTLLYIGLFIIVIAHFFRILNVILWNIRPFDYFPDIFIVFWEMITQYIGRYGGRILFISVMWISIFCVSYYTQKITIVFAEYEDRVETHDLSQYKNVTKLKIWKTKVWVTNSSTSESYLKRKGLSTVWFDSFDTMIWDLIDGKIEVIVHDDPLLRYMAAKDEKQRFNITAKTFNPEKFGIAFPEKSDLREEIDRTILKLRENWEYKEIYDKYF